MPGSRQPSTRTTRPIFGGYANENRLQVAEGLDLSAAEIRSLIGNSRAAAFSTDGAGCQRPLKRISDTRPTLQLAEAQGKLSPLKRYRTASMGIASLFNGAIAHMPAGRLPT